MDPLICLAQAANQANYWQNASTLIIGALGGGSFILAVAVLTARGYWSKSISPLILEEMNKWYHEQAQVDARSRERQAWLKDWYDKRDQRDNRQEEVRNILRLPDLVKEDEAHIKEVIDNEIKRTDGLISREIKEQVSDMEKRIVAKLDEVATFLQNDTQFKQQMVTRMAHLEGAITAMFPKMVLPDHVEKSPTPPKVK
jgi:hypothetical protein